MQQWEKESGTRIPNIQGSNPTSRTLFLPATTSHLYSALLAHITPHVPVGALTQRGPHWYHLDQIASNRAPKKGTLG